MVMQSHQAQLWYAEFSLCAFTLWLRQAKAFTFDAFERMANFENTFLEVDVASAKTECFAAAQSKCECDGEQSFIALTSNEGKQNFCLCRAEDRRLISNAAG